MSYEEALRVAITNKEDDPGFSGLYAYYKSMKDAGYAVRNEFPLMPLSIVPVQSNKPMQATVKNTKETD